MSLVAYCASDDSEESDTESIQEENLPVVPISDDEDEFQPQAQTNNSGLTSVLFSNSSLTLDAPITKQDLPRVQNKEESFVEETELEQEVRQKPSELADAPKPPSKRTKQPVKITIPSLNDLPDEEEGESKQKPVASSVRSGLFSLLPAPIHSSKKEINRPLIPHSLGKRPPPAKIAVHPPKPVSSSTNVVTKNTPSSVSVNNSSTLVQNALAGYGSDSDDEGHKSDAPQNFFSLGATTTPTVDSSSEIGGDSKAAAVKSDGDNSGTKSATTAPVPIPKEEEETVALPEPGLTNDSPLSFSSVSRFSSWTSASSNYLGGSGPSPSSHASSSGHYSSVQYNMAGEDDADHVNEFNADDDLQKMLNDKEFQKLNGKRKRGMEEAIRFVDANVDDYVDPSELSKHVTEEAEYTPIKNKEDMPTSQQKRKKQITYLAFQAKEKEMELKNTWSQNKLTRRQTQAKYGF